MNNIDCDILIQLLPTSPFLDSKLIDNFISETFQNDKRKYVNLKLNNNEKMFDIDGSSFKGRTDSNNIIGSWWNHEIINKNVQISAVSGRILPQKVKFLGKEKIILFDRKILFKQL